MLNLHLDSKWTDDERRKRIFQGDIFLFSPRPTSLEFCDFAKKALTRTFPDSIVDPRRAQFHLDVGRFIEIVGKLQLEFIENNRAKELVTDLLSDLGCDKGKTYFDLAKLRVVTHGGYLAADGLSTGVGTQYKAHRDTWAAGPLCQLNWWFPIYDLDAERTLAFCPKYWDNPVNNSSGEFDYDEWIKIGRGEAVSQIETNTRKYALPEVEIDPSEEVRFVCPAGTVLLFSAAHLHSTVFNTSGLTRFSIDFRTVNIDDLRSGNGAPKIDAEAKGTTLGVFVRASDLSPMSRDLIGQVIASK